VCVVHQHLVSKRGRKDPGGQGEESTTGGRAPYIGKNSTRALFPSNGGNNHRSAAARKVQRGGRPGEEATGGRILDVFPKYHDSHGEGEREENPTKTGSRVRIRGKREGTSDAPRRHFRRNSSGDGVHSREKKGNPQTTWSVNIGSVRGHKLNL